MSKKLINSPDSCVEDLVRGLLYGNPKLVQIKGANSVVHSSIATLRDEQVTIISGKSIAVFFFSFFFLPNRMILLNNF